MIAKKGAKKNKASGGGLNPPYHPSNHKPRRDSPARLFAFFRKVI
jgi:hypothetical protein